MNINQFFVEYIGAEHVEVSEGVIRINFANFTAEFGTVSETAVITTEMTPEAVIAAIVEAMADVSAYSDPSDYRRNGGFSATPD